jgi:DNA-binding ferritin-like protein
MQTAEMQSTNSFTNSSIDVLTQTLADENVLLIKVRNYHWNVAGRTFGSFTRFLRNSAAPSPFA